MLRGAFPALGRPSPGRRLKRQRTGEALSGTKLECRSQRAVPRGQQARSQGLPYGAIPPKPVGLHDGPTMRWQGGCTLSDSPNWEYGLADTKSLCFVFGSIT